MAKEYNKRLLVIQMCDKYKVIEVRQCKHARLALCDIF